MRIQLPILLIISGAWIACKENNLQTSFKTGMEGKPIPPFTIQLLDSISYLHSNDIPRDKNIVLFYFSPTCPYCRSQMREMIENIQIFKDKQLCILSYADLKSIKQFANYFKLESINNIIIGKDTGIVILKNYGLKSVPFTAYYDTNRNLKAAYTGLMNSNTLLGLQ